MKKVILFKVICILVLLTVQKTYSQSEVRLTLLQDARLAVAEDKTGAYKPFTLNFLTKLKLTGNQVGSGYLVISPMFEYADIEGVYKRYAIDIGFTFNEALRWGLEITPSINYGIQDRWSISWLAFGADLQASIKLNDKLRLTILGQAVERKDLKWAYNDTAISLSGFIGIEYKLRTN